MLYAFTFLCRQRSLPRKKIVYVIFPVDSTFAEAQEDMGTKRAVASTTNPFTNPDDMEGLGNPNVMEMVALSSPKTWVDDDIHVSSHTEQLHVVLSQHICECKRERTTSHI